MEVMKYIDEGYPDLLLFFAGWSASPDSFARLAVPERTDYWVVYDYRDLTLPEVTGYEHVDIVAWSLGVWVAAAVLPAKIPYRRCIAIDGTLLPVNDSYGIPVPVFKGTLDTLSETNFRKFNARMCGSRDVLQLYGKTVLRPLAEIKAELSFLYRWILECQDIAPVFRWTKAIVSSDDRIFPYVNQVRFWEEKAGCPVTVVNASHYPFYLWKSWQEIVE